MSDERKRIGDLFGVISAACAELCTLMGGTMPTGGGEKRIATDAELDGEHGDPKVHKTPKGWKGPKFDGRPFSKCSPEFLDYFGDFKDWCADNPKEGSDPKYARYDRLDAARARGWARRLRANATSTPTNGASTQPTSEQTSGDGDDEFTATDDDFKAGGDLHFEAIEGESDAEWSAA